MYKDHLIVKIIGRGSSGTVREAVKQNGQRRAIKLIDIGDDTITREIEVFNHNCVNHMFVVKCYGSWHDNNSSLDVRLESRNQEITFDIPK